MDRPIALLDSGVGGLTVLKSLVDILPNENYLYFADNAYLPYGTKLQWDLRLRLAKLLNFITKFHPKAVVIACNTASLHKEYLQSLTNVPIVEVITPTCDYVKSVFDVKKVCLLATDATVRSGRYQKLLQRVGVDVVAVSCSDFVPIAENSAIGENSTQIISSKLQPISSHDFDTVILGCTHFGLIEDKIRNILGDRNYVQCGKPTAKALLNALTCAKILSQTSKGSLNIFASGKTESACNVCKQLSLNFDSVYSVKI